tara:strand:+ start:1853 stop:2713 length:861 start_codon:yes stop_codon:yes gene_type:complete
MKVSIDQALSMSKTLKSCSKTYRLDTEIILGFIISKTREYLRAHGEKILTELQGQQFEQMLNKRKQGVPVAYIVGNRHFWDFELTVNEAVLIPRPETELLVDIALKTLSASKQTRKIADLGTGSGAIAIALARENPDWCIDATDISPQALDVARVNARNLKVSNVNFYEGSWCDGFSDCSFDLIVANPPYLTFDDDHLKKGGLQFEPILALAANDSGYSELNEIIRESRRCLKKDSWLLLEHGYDQQNSLIEKLKSYGYSDVLGVKDYSGLDRVVTARWGGKDNWS